MDRKWIVLAAIASLSLVLFGCPPKQTPPPQTPPPTQPSTDVHPVTEPAPVADVKEEPPPWDARMAEEDARTKGLLGDVFFEFDKYEIQPAAQDRLNRNAEFMKANPDLLFTIEGHCDERGTNEYNLALGQRRSTSALDVLAELGVERSRFKTISYGEEKPFCTESDEACWQKNRRARFVVTGRR